MKVKLHIFFVVFFGLIFWSLFAAKGVSAGCSGTVTCGHVSCSAWKCSDGSSCTGTGSPCGNGGTCLCTATGSCVADQNPKACTCGSSECGTCSTCCEMPGATCANPCTPGACVSSGACYTVAGQCIQSGWDGCSSCFNDCPGGCGGGPYCGDGSCNGDEDCGSCSDDCACPSVTDKRSRGRQT
jgi:hypothetical protein